MAVTGKKEVRKPEIWRCSECGLTISPSEAWLDNGGTLCPKHGLRKRIRRERKIWG